MISLAFLCRISLHLSRFSIFVVKQYMSDSFMGLVRIIKFSGPTASRICREDSCSEASILNNSLSTARFF